MAGGRAQCGQSVLSVKTTAHHSFDLAPEALGSDSANGVTGGPHRRHYGYDRFAERFVRRGRQVLEVLRRASRRSQPVDLVRRNGRMNDHDDGPRWRRHLLAAVARLEERVAIPVPVEIHDPILGTSPEADAKLLASIIREIAT